MSHTVKAGEFKAKCLKIMDQVAATGEVVTITKRGRPVAQLGPVVEKPGSILGFAKDMI
ncbi:MAG: type II toxin-antitoxin system Phd/YefM family antitoxin, partial [Alphaproteobacteria bacterium]